MKRYLLRSLALLIITLSILSCKVNKTSPTGQTPVDILIVLQNLQGVTVKELPAEEHFNRVFEIYITQPVDHENSTGASFAQKVYIGHVGEELPVVLETEGYSRDNFKIRDLAPALSCNQISIEHRYNGSSIPVPTDWEYLTIKQAADDIHKIVNLLKGIYTGSWVSSGRSKGGDTAIFHRRFYPNDVDATVAIVAPILFSDNDSRIGNHLNSLGDETCRNKIREFQRNVFMKSDSIVTLLPALVTWVNDNYNTDFTYSIPYEDVIKYAAIEYPFEFWSSTIHNCSSIPETTASVQELFDHIIEVVDIFLFYSDYGIDFWRGWFYQAQTEIGNFELSTDHLDDLIGDLRDIKSIYDFGHELVFDSYPMQDIDNWVKNESNKILFVYGEKDPWSAAQFDASNNDVIKIINPGTKHETTLYDLTSSDKELLKSKLSEWLNYDNISF